MSKELVLSITIKDCKVETFRAGGKGGQNQNKVESGVRIVHEPSGAVGEARDSRDQLRNKRAAFRRMTETKEFQHWLRMEVMKLSTGLTIDEIVDEQMTEENLKVEVRKDGVWQEEK